mgnify:CR=1 FL=1
MNRKTTLKSFSLFFALAFGSSLNAQQIYTNGGLSTGANSASGVAAPAGYTWSELQSETGNTTESNTNFGFGAVFNNAGTTNLQIADDFVVPAGSQFNVTSFDFFVYQTGYTGTVIPFDQLRVQIFSSNPSVAGAVSVAGNMTTNVLDVANSGDALMYRTANSVTPSPGTVPGTTRKIWRLRGNLTASLPAGTYWVVFQGHPTNDAGAFLPPVTVVGTRGLAGWNAIQNTITAGVSSWLPLLDTGNPAAAPDVAMDMPFLINGTVVLSNKDNAFDASISFAPNPIKNSFSVNVPTDVILSNIEILDLNGKLIKEIKVTNPEKLEFNISDLSTGNYLLKLVSASGTAVKKFIKE